MTNNYWALMNFRKAVKLAKKAGTPLLLEEDDFGLVKLNDIPEVNSRFRDYNSFVCTANVGLYDSLEEYINEVLYENETNHIFISRYNEDGDTMVVISD